VFKLMYGGPGPWKTVAMVSCELLNNVVSSPTTRESSAALKHEKLQAWTRVNPVCVMCMHVRVVCAGVYVGMCAYVSMCVRVYIDEQ
jgi:hypothetical protein